jgi:hypothetical protein
VKVAALGRVSVDSYSDDIGSEIVPCRIEALTLPKNGVQVDFGGDQRFFIVKGV